MTSWQPIETAPKNKGTISVRWRLVSERHWHKARASYRTELKPALFDPLTGECFAEARELSGWMYEDQPYLIPGVVEWINT
jgi:hypothetical protein